MHTAAEVLQILQDKSRPDQIAGMARFGMATEQRLGIAMPELRALAKSLGKDHRLARALWRSGIPEARILAAMIADPEKLTECEMESWVKGFNSWDVCDQVCMNLFAKSPLAWRKITAWSRRQEEYVKRAAFALLACLAWHDPEAPDTRFLKLFPVIARAATDERNFVKKAVNWALRNIGKRNPRLNQAAIQFARQLQRTPCRPARWIAADALRELSSVAVQRRFRG